MFKRSRVPVLVGLMLAAASSFHLRATQLKSAAPALTYGQASAPTATAATERALLDKYCVTCHGERLKVGNLSLERLNIERVGEAPQAWEGVAHMLRTGAMPPAGAARPEPAAARDLASSLELKLDRLAAAAPNAGTIPPHRLNRTEYANAIRDLLGVDVSTSQLPADGSFLGFDNIAGVLTVSPTLLERYMSVARQVSRQAIGDPTLTVVPVVYQIEPMLKQLERPDENLPFGARGLTLRHNFPLDGEYMIQVRLRRGEYEYIRGMAREPQPLDIRIDGARVKRFDRLGQRVGMPPPEGYPQTDLGDADWENNALEGDAGLDARFTVKAGNRVIGIAFPAKRWESDEVVTPSPGLGNKQLEDRDGNITVATVSVSGPFGAVQPTDSASRRKIFTCQPANTADEDRCATKILTTLAHRAYRRPLVDADVQRLLGFCRMGKETRGFEGCIEMGLERILASPHFLFRVARFANDRSSASAPAAARLSDLDLASRLSFFLWSSIPDDQLLEAAEKGTLHESAVLERQVRRMLADARSNALVDSFAAQWLQLRTLDAGAPSEDLFPDFDADLRDAFKQETERFLESMLHEDRPIGELLTANYTFVNERLARHYGIPDIAGSHFRRVTLPDDKRMGLLGQGSILTVTSQATRTSPVLRGKWLLENILGTPVPPPPPNVPPLAENNGQALPQTVRARLEQHRKNPVCATCHGRMDPWGFALENFDATGAWRDKEDGIAIDTAATLLDGTKLNGPIGVRQVLIGRREQFVETVTEKLLVYALGRPVEYYDRPALRKIVQSAAAHEDRWSSVVLGIVNSLPFQFQMRGAD